MNAHNVLSYPILSFFKLNKVGLWLFDLHLFCVWSYERIKIQLPKYLQSVMDYPIAFSKLTPMITFFPIPKKANQNIASSSYKVQLKITHQHINSDVTSAPWLLYLWLIWLCVLNTKTNYQCYLHHHSCWGIHPLPVWLPHQRLFYQTELVERADSKFDSLRQSIQL